MSWLLSGDSWVTPGESDKLFNSGIESRSPTLAMAVSKFCILVIMEDFHLKEHY